MFFFRELEHEVGGKAVDVPLDGLNECSGLDAIEFGQVGVKHHLFPADQINAAGNTFDGNNELRSGHAEHCRGPERVSSWTNSARHAGQPERSTRNDLSTVNRTTDLADRDKGHELQPAKGAVT